jgi:hypothetical protein
MSIHYHVVTLQDIQTEHYYVMENSTGEAMWDLIYTDGRMDGQTDVIKSTLSPTPQT